MARLKEWFRALKDARGRGYTYRKMTEDLQALVPEGEIRLRSDFKRVAAWLGGREGAGEGIPAQVLPYLARLFEKDRDEVVARMDRQDRARYAEYVMGGPERVARLREAAARVSEETLEFLLSEFERAASEPDPGSPGE